MYSHEVWGLVGLGVGIVTLAELLCWALVYRTPAYARQKDALEKASSKLQAMRAVAVKGKKDKKQQQLEDRMKDLARDMGQIKSKTGMVFAGTILVGYYVVSKLHSGKIVAKLPFHAPGLMQRLTHNGLEGEDFTDCGAAFIVIMTVQALRVSSQKFLGVANRAAAKMNSMESYINERLEKAKVQ